MDGDVFRLRRFSLVQRASDFDRLIAESLNDRIELYDDRCPNQRPRSVIDRFVSLVDSIGKLLKNGARGKERLPISIVDGKGGIQSAAEFAIADFVRGWER